MSAAYRIVDIECYHNYFLLLAMDPETGVVYRWERHNDEERGREKIELESMLASHITVTFNGLGYDWWMLSGYIAGYHNAELKELSDFLITTPMAQWNVTGEFRLEAYPGNHIDLMPVAPLIAGLKVYAGRLNAPKLQDLPVDPSRRISETLRDMLIPYCVNDLHSTNLLHRKLKPQILLRHRMGKKYGMDLKSKSDPQIAEAVIKKLLSRQGVRAYKPKSVPAIYTYDRPSCVSFHTDELRAAQLMATGSEFVMSKSGKLLFPPDLRQPIVFRKRTYRMGIGGLHSCEKSQSIRVPNGQFLTDLDVTSYYPRLILTNELFPEHLGKKFLDVYRSLVEDRVRAKHEGDNVTADALKIVINSSFGKFGNKYSVLFSPKLLLQTTISGQLYLLMLIEWIELRTSCKVVSANTDGITVYSPNLVQYDRMRSQARKWERQTQMQLEYVEYEALFAQDVNNYLAIKKEGKPKGKGVFATSSLSKNPNAPIVQRAASQLLAHGVALEETIGNCRDIRAFAILRKVTGGAVYKDQSIGSTVRWYHSLNGSPLLYEKNVNRVPGGDKAMLINQLPSSFPNDIDYDEYLYRANEIVENVGGIDTVNAAL